MPESARARRARIVEALGLGPSWVLRDVPDACTAGAVDWVIVTRASSADVHADPVAAASAVRLRDAMLAAIGVSANDSTIVDAADRQLDRKVAASNPKVVLVFGTAAAAALAGGAVQRGMHRLFVGERETIVVVTHDPAWLLSRPEDKAEAWRDLCAARAAVEEAPV